MYDGVIAPMGCRVAQKVTIQEGNYRYLFPVKSSYLIIEYDAFPFPLYYPVSKLIPHKLVAYFNSITPQLEWKFHDNMIFLDNHRKLGQEEHNDRLRDFLEDCPVDLSLFIVHVDSKFSGVPGLEKLYQLLRKELVSASRLTEISKAFEAPSELIDIIGTFI